MFKTEIRNTCLGLIILISKLFVTISPRIYYFADLNDLHIFFILLVFGLIYNVSLYFLPETLGKDMQK